MLTDREGRIIFVMPYGRYVLVGTTDTDFHGDRDTVTADRNDIEYLLAVVGDALPQFALTLADVVSSFAGLRALPSLAAHASPSSVPREEVILQSPSGLITVAGGKLTTHRRIAEGVVDLICESLGLCVQKSPTFSVPLPGACEVIEAASTHGSDYYLSSSAEPLQFRSFVWTCSTPTAGIGIQRRRRVLARVDLRFSRSSERGDFEASAMTRGCAEASAVRGLRGNGIAPSLAVAAPRFGRRGLEFVEGCLYEVLHAIEVGHHAQICAHSDTPSLTITKAQHAIS